MVGGTEASIGRGSGFPYYVSLSCMGEGGGKEEMPFFPYLMTSGYT